LRKAKAVLALGGYWGSSSSKDTGSGEADCVSVSDKAGPGAIACGRPRAVPTSCSCRHRSDHLRTKDLVLPPLSKSRYQLEGGMGFGNWRLVQEGPSFQPRGLTQQKPPLLQDNQPETTVRTSCSAALGIRVSPLHAMDGVLVARVLGRESQSKQGASSASRI